MPSDLYRFAARDSHPVSLQVNGQAVPVVLRRGFVRLERPWKKGDVIELRLPMPIRRVLANPRVAADAGRVALERGPIVYCVEGVDNGGNLQRLVLKDRTPLQAEYRPGLLDGVEIIHDHGLLAIPYYAWSNRGAGPMEVWLPRKP